MLCGVAVVLVPQGGWILPAVLLLCTAPSLGSVVVSSLRRRKWQLRATPLERRTGYYDYMLTAREAAAEMRAYHLTQGFSTAYQKLRSGLRRERLDLVRSESILELAAMFLGFGVAAAAAFWVANEALTGRLTAGALAMFYAAFVQGQGAMRSVLGSFGGLFANGLLLSNLFAFLALDTEVGPKPLTAKLVEVQAEPRPAKQGIGFEDVDFSYPGSNRRALSGFTLKIPAGKTVAIVGPNGAGKSTVFKLLCRFYEPDAGRILLDGEEIRSKAPFEIRRSLSVLFQDPVRFSSTLEDSVSLGSEPASAKQVRMAIRAAEAEEIVARLPEQYETPLGREFEYGAELSGGEWRRIALARAIMRPAPFLLLDEPTSAMDSWAEADWFDRLREATTGRTTLIITHRFTTATQADVVYVMHEGRIVESGSHDELLKLGGRYAFSWARQTREISLARAG